MTLVYHIHLFGPVEVEKEGASLRGFHSRKALALLGYLIRQNRPVARDYLSHLLWPNSDERRARRNLRSELSRLNRLLPNSLEIDRHNIRFQPDDSYWVDTAAFETLVSPPSVPPFGGEAFKSSPLWATEGRLEGGGNPNHLAQAAALYRGDFMSGHFLRGCPDFEVWLVQEQEFWRQRATKLLEWLIRHQTSQNEDTQAQEHARRWLTLESWREQPHAYLMRLLAQDGQSDAALTQYEAYRQALERELGMEPSAEMAALYEQIVDRKMGREGERETR